MLETSARLLRLLSLLEARRDWTGPQLAERLGVTTRTVRNDVERLRFGYHAHDGTDTVRLTEPHRLVSSGRRWYLLAWDTGRRDWRTFRVDQMDLRSPAGPRFTPREMPDEEVIGRLSRGLATATWRYRARVTVYAPAAVIADRLPAAITVTPAGPDACVIEAGSDSPAMLALYLGMLDADFRVDEAAAPELAGYLGTLSARYARAAQSATAE